MRRLAAVSLALLASACSSRFEAVQPGATLPLAWPATPADTAAYHLRPGDQLDVKFYFDQQLNEQVTVQPDGTIALQLIEDVPVVGLTVRELRAEIKTRYRNLLEKTDISVILLKASGQIAYAGGEVAVPQVVPVVSGMTVMQALVQVGGLRETADPQAVILIRKGRAGEPVPYRLDLSEEALALGKRDFAIALQPSDVVYVPRSPIARADLWVKQYIQQLVLFNGFNLGFQGLYDVSTINTTSNSTVVAAPIAK